MNPISKVAATISRRSRKKRRDLFRRYFSITDETKILDLGSETGSNIHNVLEGAPILPKNVYIADINAEFVNEGHERFGYTPVFIDESEPLDFPDGFFDIVYCSSVIEHVTVHKDQVWSLRSGKKFKQLPLARQRQFAEDIKRLGKQYFVQTPYKFFPVESHTWLPFIAWFPRRLLLSALNISNRFWVKKTMPDWYLLNKREMAELFEDATIIDEKFFGFTKSIMAVSSIA